MTSQDKADEIRQLAEKRKAARWPGYFQVEEFHDGKHECDFVTPYTKSAYNFDADLFLMLQDWTSEKSLRGPEKPDQIKLGYTPGRPTNKNLIRLLHEVYNLELADTFATNLFPFIKPGSIGASIPRKYLEQAAREFAIPQVEIIKPKVVMCFGLATFRAVQVALGVKRATSAADAMANPLIHSDTTFYSMAHPGALGVANRGGFKEVKKDWEAIREATGPL